MSTVIGPQSARSGVWLNSFQDPSAGLTTAQPLLLLTDVETPGDSGVFICDYDKCRIRLYLGASAEWEQRLMEVPSCIAAFKPLANEPPLIAVGAGPCLYIYKGLKPHLKFSLPDCVCAQKEIFTTDEKKTSRLIVGLENGSILLLDLHASAINKSFAIACAPVSLEVSGILADYYIFAICRNKHIYRLSGADGAPPRGADVKGIPPWSILPQTPVSSCRSQTNLHVACMGGLLLSFDLGKSEVFHSVELKAPIVSLASFVSHKNAIVVGLACGEIVVLVNHVKMQSLHLDVSLSALALGAFARESDVLIAVTQTGALVTKILVRGSFDKPALAEEKRAIDIPKKSPLFFELMDRERINFKSMAKNYLTDMTNLKALALEELIDLHREKKTALKEVPTIRLLGLGPEYRMIVALKAVDQGTSVTVSLTNVDELAYKFTPSSQTFKSNVHLKPAFNFELTDFDKFSGRPVKLTISRDNQMSLQTIVNVPPSEPPLILD